MLYRYKGRGTVTASGYFWNGTGPANDPARIVDVTDDATLKKLATHPSFEAV